jgi:CheY-like chemotaxis protein
MTKEQQLKLFQRFVQADGIETTKQFGGSGLGLAISREFSILMGGDIQVSSEPNCGATFSLNIPLEITKELGDDQSSEFANLRKGPIKINSILLVEDDETIQTVVSQLLQADGHIVTIAKNALEALAQTMINSYEIIFCDIDMPGMTGFELTKVWRGQGLKTPIVALTARTQSDTEQKCFDSGMNYFLRKPVSSKQLHEAVLVMQKLSLVSSDQQ